MRAIEYIVIHCTATSVFARVESILNYWKDKLGWKNPGYHFMIDGDGKLHELLDIRKVANGVRGYNSNSIHVSYIGGQGGKDTRTPSQKKTLAAVVKVLSAFYPDAKVQGHRDFPRVKKDCPAFDVKAWLETI